MKRTKRISTTLISLLLSSIPFIGCTSSDVPINSNNQQPTQIESQELTELDFYMMNGATPELDRIMEKSNQIIAEELNAKMNLIMIDNSTYAEKMNLMINSNDPFDLCFTASWGGVNFFENAAKGAYADLTDLLPQYAPKSYSRIPVGLWDGVKVNGRIYGVVNYQQWGCSQRRGYIFRSDMTDEVNFDWKSIKNMPPLAALTKIGDELIGPTLVLHPDMIGWETTANDSFYNEALMWDMEAVGDISIPGYVKFTDPTKVVNQYELPEFLAYCNIMRDWHNKGYVRKDGATLTDPMPDRKEAKVIAAIHYGWPDTLDAQEAGCYVESLSKMSMVDNYQDAPAYTVSTTRTIIPAAAGSSSAVAISAESKNITKSLELIELLNTNDTLFLLLTQGEEGIDYVYDDAGMHTLLEGKYNFNWNEWQIGQSYSPTFSRALFAKGESGELERKKLSLVYESDRTATLSPLSGFTFNTTPIKRELANVSSVLDEMLPALNNGAVDPAIAVPIFLERLRTAGIDNIITEKQTQLDIFNANK